MADKQHSFVLHNMLHSSTVVKLSKVFFVPDEDPRGRNIVHCNYCTCLAT